MRSKAEMKVNPIAYAILAAALYALNTPLSKLLLDDIGPDMLAGLLYLGAGAGMLIIWLLQGKGAKNSEERLSSEDLPYTAAMVVLDIAAPILMMTGLGLTSPANASLLNNFEIVATSVIALAVFGEKIKARLWAAIVLITASSMLLTAGDESSLDFSIGSVFVLLACTCWGIENNCTGKLSRKNPIEIVVVKGLGSGTGAFIIALISGESLPSLSAVIPALLLGFASYGLSIFFYVYAQRYLGAARTSAYYAVSPFIGTAISLLIFRTLPSPLFITALLMMAAGAWLASAIPEEQQKQA